MLKLSGTNRQRAATLLLAVLCLAVGAGLALAGGLISYVAGRGVGRYVVTAIGCLAVSGVTRLLEFWIAQGGGGIT